MASTAYEIVTRPLSAPVGSFIGYRSTNVSTANAGSTGPTIGMPSAVRQITAQTVVSTGGSTKATVTISGSLNPAGGWTVLKSTTWTSTQKGTIRVVATSTNRPVTHLRVGVDMSTTASTGLGDVTVYLAATP